VSGSELNERSSFRKLMKRYRKSRRSGAFVQVAENAHLQNKRKPFVIGRLFFCNILKSELAYAITVSSSTPMLTINNRKSDDMNIPVIIIEMAAFRRVVYDHCLQDHRQENYDAGA
jgi:hypothetical protein